MCIAIAKPPGALLTKATLLKCFSNNPDGCGFAYPREDGGGVRIVKGFFKFKKFWNAFRDVQKYEIPMIVHFRVATSGEICAANCHPWQIDEDHAMIHNGMVSDRLGVISKTPDTQVLVDHVLKPIFGLNKDIWKTEAFSWLLAKAVGDNNKIVILSKNGDLNIINESKGEWENGIWFSNTTYKESRKSTVTARQIVEYDTTGKLVCRTKRGSSTSFKPIYTSLFESIEEVGDKKDKDSENIIIVDDEAPINVESGDLDGVINSESVLALPYRSDSDVERLALGYFL